jgi:hypothetical protein
MNKRRTHSKVTQELPPELVDEINRLLKQGVFYDDIVVFLKEKGHNISRSSVGRYGRNFLNCVEELNIFREQTKIVVEQKGDAPATDMAEAASMFAIQKLFNYLLDPNLSVKEKTEVMKVIALLEKSGVSREKLKMDYIEVKEAKKKADKAVQTIEETAKKKGLDPETLAIIKEQVYGIV